MIERENRPVNSGPLNYGESIKLNINHTSPMGVIPKLKHCEQTAKLLVFCFDMGTLRGILESNQVNGYTCTE